MCTHKMQKKKLEESLFHGPIQTERTEQVNAPQPGLLQEQAAPQQVLQHRTEDLDSIQAKQADPMIRDLTKKQRQVREAALQRDGEALLAHKPKKVKHHHAKPDRDGKANQVKVDKKQARKLTRKKNPPPPPVDPAAEQLAERERLAQEADQHDQRMYKLRHFFYDMSKSIVMGFKKLRSKHKKVKEKRTTTVSLNDAIKYIDQGASESYMLQLNAKLNELRTRVDSEGADYQKLLDEETITLPMVSDENIFLGGTKPMSQYIGADGSKWLAKQAVNCLGYRKMEGALLTQAGANLQKLVDPATAIDAFVGKTQKHGDVSFQRRLAHVESSRDPGGKLDLFKFSKHPELADQNTIREVEKLGPQLLREHTTDWLLCNFDTKGENFVITRNEKEERVLHGIDKEAAFNNILDPGAQAMSTTYKPHANNTLYNVVFTMFANNQMDLDLNAVLPQIQKVEAMSEIEYMGLFRDYLDHLDRKCHSKLPGKNARLRRKYHQTMENIIRRKTNLRQDYQDFFTTLINQRCQKLDELAAQALRDKYFGPEGNCFRFGPAN